MDYLKLVESELNISELMELVASPSCGATSVFVGTTRDNFEGKVVKKLVYEAYNGMAQKCMKKVCDDIRSRWNVHGIAIYHRLGEVAVKEASIAIAISSVHRAESLQAVQYAIDHLKAEVPIWKKEEYEGEDHQWKENTESSWIKTEPQDTPQYNVNRVSKLVDDVPPELIQVKADSLELKRRIEAFMEFKRNQVNLSNVRDFCGNANSESSCARVDAVVVRQKDSKSHLRVRKVLNMTGPQTRGIEQVPNISSPAVENFPFKQRIKQEPVSNLVRTSTNTCSAIEERLQNAELHLGLTSDKTLRPIPKDVYTRLKDLEDRILFLEGLSPEYSHALMNPTKFEAVESKPNSLFKKRVYTVDDLDFKMKEIEKCIERSSK